MSPDQYAELNERLATPPMVDVAVSRMMGLVVVARLAARHGVKTELRQGGDRGTIADVLMPSGVLVPRALAGRGQMPSGFPAVHSPIAGPSLAPSGYQPPAPPQRPAFPAPLALESGPSWGGASPPPWGAPPNGAPPAPAPAWNGAPSGPAPSLWDPPPVPTNGGGGPGYSHGTPGTAPGFAAPPTAAGGLGAALISGGFDLPRGPVISPGRSLPAWHDLTGAGPEQPLPGSPETPLPQRRPQWSDEPGMGVPQQAPPGDHWAAGAPAAPPVSRPPSWPPVADDGMPSLPQNLSASLDMTSEIPRTRPGAPPSAGGGYDHAARYSDDMTMELPIFQELESAWFTSTPPADAPSSPAPGWPPTEASEPVRARTGNWSDGPSAAMAGAAGARRTGRTEGAGGPASEVSWRSAADDGWRAAEAAIQPHDGGSTDMGLPRRVPMAQLVPGGVETPTGGSDRRSPDSVRGLLSAYHRGVQRGRSAHGAGDAESHPQSSGREQEA
jgi:hypothetical protein